MSAPAAAEVVTSVDEAVAVAERLSTRFGAEAEPGMPRGSCPTRRFGH